MHMWSQRLGGRLRDYRDGLFSFASRDSYGSGAGASASDSTRTG